MYGVASGTLRGRRQHRAHAPRGGGACGGRAAAGRAPSRRPGPYPASAARPCRRPWSRLHGGVHRGSQSHQSSQWGAGAMAAAAVEAVGALPDSSVHNKHTRAAQAAVARDVSAWGIRLVRRSSSRNSVWQSVSLQRAEVLRRERFIRHATQKAVEFPLARLGGAPDSLLQLPAALRRRCR